MVRHDHPGQQPIALAIEVLPVVDDDLSALGACEDAGPVAGVEIGVDSFAATAVAVFRGEICQFAPEVFQDLRWERVGETVGDGLDGVVAVKMGEVAAG
jgi:hypothetical protein